MSEPDAGARIEKRSRCPICGNGPVKEYRPFCSKRCADIDLGRWLNGVYAIPAEGEADENDGCSGSAGAEAEKTGSHQD